MVARTGGYYGTVFQGARGVMQGYLVSPHHIQCGGGCGGETLGGGDGRGRGGSGRAWTGG